MGPDIRKELEQAVKLNELVLGAAGEGIYGLDSDGLTTFVNPAAVRILGYAEDDLIGQPMHALLHHSHPDGSDYPRRQCPIYQAFKDGKIHRVADEVFWRKDGSSFPVEYVSTPIREDDGALCGAVVVFRDITARIQTERERDGAFREIKRLNNELERERDYLREEVDITFNFGEIVGESPALKQVMARVDAVARTDASVLIHGESGVGKELVARAIHNRSARAQAPLVRVNCASIPRELFESEFFGHVKGAFTGAHRDRVGRFQLADGGTLFLDEVGEIPLELQGKLLRALQEGEFERVGEDRTRSVNVRIIAASNRDLEQEVDAGRFRRDLYYRLSVFPIDVPPLRKRREDVIPLALFFLERSCLELGRPAMKISRAQADRLKKYQWCGNVRELQNVIERAIILSDGERLRLELAMGDSGGTATAAEPDAGDSSVAGYLTAIEMEQAERSNLIAAMEAAGWKVSGAGGAAELLGVKPTTLAYQLRKHAVHKPREGG